MTGVARVGVYKARAAGGKRVLTLRLRAGGTPPPPADPTLAEVSGRVTACKNMGHQKYFLMIKVMNTWQFGIFVLFTVMCVMKCPKVNF